MLTFVWTRQDKVNVDPRLRNSGMTDRDAGGSVITRYNYSPFGHTEVIGTDVPQPFRFTGREWDSETGLYYYRARYYSPDMRRFISEDPIRFAAGDVNFYAYVGNGPMNLTDPLGLATRQCRPLDKFGRVSIPFDKDTWWRNHDAFFYEDGTNSGYYKGEGVVPDPKINLLDQY